MKRLLLLIAVVFTAPNASAADILVSLANGTSADITIESREGVSAEVPPGEVRIVRFQQPQWLRLGQEAYRFDTTPVSRRLKADPTAIVLQVHTDGRLYLLPSGTRRASATLPPQPRGFPLAPTRKADLT